MTTLEKLKQVQVVLEIYQAADDGAANMLKGFSAKKEDISANSQARAALSLISSIMDEIKETEENERDYRANYHRIMGLLQAADGVHGLCRPRWRKACSVCNARDTIDYLLGEYKGAEIVRSTKPTEDA